MTIAEAVVEVMRKSKEPLRCAEIARRIQMMRLHALPTRHPVSVVNKAVRRHCVGVVTDGARANKLFESVGNRAYRLTKT